MQDYLEGRYRSNFRELSNGMKSHVLEVLDGSYPEHQEYLEEILVDVPTYWDFEESGFKKMTHVSGSSIESVMNSLAKEDEIENLEKPFEDREKDYDSNISYFLSALDDITEDEMSETSDGKYNVESFDEKHMYTIKQALG